MSNSVAPQRRTAGAVATLPEVILFLNAGDPDLATTEALLLQCDAARVPWVELAIPFPDSPTDGPVIRRSADRALAAGATTDAVLDLVRRVRPRLTHTKIVVLADWAHTVRPLGLRPGLEAIRASGADGVLLHALPPLFRADYEALAAELGLPVVTSCYAGKSDDRTMQAAAAGATAYVYLVAAYGRTGGALSIDAETLAASVAQLKAAPGYRGAPVAVGFGVRDRSGLERVAHSRADAAVIGTACVESVERGLPAVGTPESGAPATVATSFQAFLDALAISSQPQPSTADHHEGGPHDGTTHSGR